MQINEDVFKSSQKAHYVETMHVMQEMLYQKIFYLHIPQTF